MAIPNLTGAVLDEAGNIYSSSVIGTDVVSLNPDGSERWRKTIPNETTVKVDFMDNQGHLYVRGAKTLYALNISDRSVPWSFSADADLAVGAVLAPGGDIFLSDINSNLYLLDTCLSYANSAWPVAEFGNRRHTQKANDVLPLPGECSGGVPRAVLETPEQPVYDEIPPPVADPGKRKHLVLIVHGWNSNAATWASPMAAKIQTQLTPDPNVTWDIGIRVHAWPYCWYDGPLESETCMRDTEVTNSTDYGFNLSLESGKAQLENHDNPLFVRGHECILLSESSPCEDRFPISRPALNINLSPGPPFNIWTGDGDRFLSSDTGTVALSTPGVIRLSTTSPVWISVQFNVSQQFNAIQFDHGFLSGAQGLLSVFFDNQLVFRADERQTWAALLPPEPIPVGLVSPGFHTLSFRLDSFAGIQSIAEISNIRTVVMEVVRVTNQNPIANAGLDQTKQCVGAAGTPVSLDGSASADANGDPLSFTWTGPFGTASGATPSVTLPLGVHAITPTVNDGNGGTASDTVSVSVVDTAAPTIASVTATPNALSPPNHKMVSVSVAAAASDACSQSANCKIVSVSSSEPVNGLGDGDTAPDWEITGNLSLNLRAECSGTSGGRVYTVLVECSDASGNKSTKPLTVAVPRSQTK